MTGVAHTYAHQSEDGMRFEVFRQKPPVHRLGSMHVASRSVSINPLCCPVTRYPVGATVALSPHKIGCMECHRHYLPCHEVPPL